MVVGVRVVSAAVASLALALLAVPSGHAQTPATPASPPLVPRPITSFVSPFEIVRTVRLAGFDPLAPPLREGTSYVLRATDFRGVLMRIVVDARSGAIRDATPIVPGPGRYGEFAMPPRYGELPPYGAPPYGRPNEAPMLAPNEPSVMTLSPRPPAAFTTIHPPLPRPRPQKLVSGRATDNARSSITSGAKPDTKADGKPAAKPETPPDTKTDIKSDTAIAAPTAVPAAPKKAPAVVPLND